MALARISPPAARARCALNLDRSDPFPLRGRVGRFSDLDALEPRWPPLTFSQDARPRAPAATYGASLDQMIVPEAPNMPPTPWLIEIFAPGTWAGATPRSCRTLSWMAYMPYMPECM